MKTKVQSILSFVKGKQQTVDSYNEKTKVLKLVSNDGTIQVFKDIEPQHAKMLIDLGND